MNISSKPGLYLHIPFCQSKCGYCDFYSQTDLSLVSPFVKALLREIKLLAETIRPSMNFDTVYIGGGTPSLLSEKSIDLIFNSLSKYFTLDQKNEITIEVNPGTVSQAKLKYLRALGINRLSIGVQSFNDRELHLLGRIHSAVQAKHAILKSRENGFDNINIDLIFALPGQTLEEWRSSLQTTLDFKPEHLSVYNLTYEKGTPFYQLLQQGELRPLNDTKEFDLFMYAESLLAGNGYHHYEISNYSLSDLTISRHNYKYWTHVSYLGFGPGAHSFWNNSRRANIDSVSKYIEDLKKGSLPHGPAEDLTREQLKFEHIFLSLRTYRGLYLKKYEKKFGVRFASEFASVIDYLVKQNLGVISDTFFRLTNNGMLMYNEILPDFSI
jgi:oxygen-independent coproporphyrinogen-3 oxidase